MGKNLKNFLLFFMLSILQPAMAKFGKTEEQLLNSAVKAYDNSNFSEAASFFEKINPLKASSGVYYNLGNCYLKMGKTGHAIAYYYSALARDPKDPDILENLKFTLSLTKYAYHNEKEITAVKGSLVKFMNNFSLKIHQIAFIIMFSFLLIILIIFKISKNSLFYKKTFSILILIILSFQGYFLYVRHGTLNKKAGILISGQAQVRYGPDLNENINFIIYEGCKFQIFNSLKSWTQIRIADGKIGWIPSVKFINIS